MTKVSDVLAILSFLGAAQGLFIALVMVSLKRGNIVANRLLAVLVFAISIYVLGAIVRTTGYDLIVPHLSRLHDPFPFLAGPLLFLYLRTLINKTAVPSGRDLLHFVPFGICVLYLLPYYFQSAADKSDVLFAESQQVGMGDYYYVRSVLVILLFLVYLISSVWMLVGHSRVLENQSKQIDRNLLFQVKFLVTACAAVVILGALRYALDHTAQANLLVPLTIAWIFYGLGYICLIKPEVMTGTEKPQPTAPKYEKSTLIPQRAERYLSKLLHVMETEKPYLDGELTVLSLAEKLSIPAQHLSQIINERQGQTFSDFVNAYRVEEVKKLLLDPAKKHYSILALAEEVGFNSKSSFNSVFKKHTNVTPSAFRNSKQAE